MKGIRLPRQGSKPWKIVHFVDGIANIDDLGEALKRRKQLLKKFETNPWDTSDKEDANNGNHLDLNAEDSDHESERSSVDDQAESSDHEPREDKPL